MRNGRNGRTPRLMECIIQTRSFHVHMSVVTLQPVFLCKHLIGEKRCPQYRDVTIRRSHPFISISHKSTTPRANVDNEYHSDAPAVMHVTAMTNEERTGHVRRRLSTPIQMADLLQPSGEAVECSHAAPIQETINWFLSHVSDLGTGASGHRQVEYLRKSVMKPLVKYRQSVEKALNKRRQQKKWSDRHMLFLP